MAGLYRDPGAVPGGGGTLRVVPNIGVTEIVLVLLAALLIFGPKRLPELGRSLGRGMREFKEAISGNSKDDDDEVTHLKASERDLETSDRA